MEVSLAESKKDAVRRCVEELERQAEAQMLKDKQLMPLVGFLVEEKVGEMQGVALFVRELPWFRMAHVAQWLEQLHPDKQKGFESLRAEARRLMEAMDQGDKKNQAAFVKAFDVTVGLLAEALGYDRPQAVAKALVRRHAERLQADGGRLLAVVRIEDTYVLATPVDVPRAELERLERDGISQEPGRQEALMTTVEHLEADWLELRRRRYQRDADGVVSFQARRVDTLPRSQADGTLFTFESPQRSQA